MILAAKGIWICIICFLFSTVYGWCLTLALPDNEKLPANHWIHKVMVLFFVGIFITAIWYVAVS